MHRTLLLLAALFVGPATASAQSSPQRVVERAVAGYPDHAASPGVVATSTTSARTDADIPQWSTVRILCTADTFVTMGDSAVSASTGSKLWVIGGLPEVFSTGANRRIAFVLASGTGTCSVVILR